MYDGATAFVEALLMAVRISTKKTVIISSAVHPEYRECIKTYFSQAGLHVIEIAFDKTGRTTIEALRQALANNTSEIAAIAFQSPNFFGRFENAHAINSLAHAHNALAIQGVTDMTSLAIASSPGTQGVDIAIGEGLGLLGGINLGGPGVGLLACRKEYVRQMPGRLVGKTCDTENRAGYVLTLSTREQHIRREKATSNICTNHNLMALAFTMTLAAYGKSGFVALAKINLKKTLYFRRVLAQLNKVRVFAGAHYNETVVDVGPRLTMRIRVAEKMHLVAGLILERFFPHLDGHLLVCCTELHRDEDIERLAEILSGVYDDDG
jgi:glycine dehydrogenase subunit 1